MATNIFHFILLSFGVFAPMRLTLSLQQITAAIKLFYLTQGEAKGAPISSPLKNVTCTLLSPSIYKNYLVPCHQY